MYVFYRFSIRVGWSFIIFYENGHIFEHIYYIKIHTDGKCNFCILFNWNMCDTFLYRDATKQLVFKSHFWSRLTKEKSILT